MDENIFLARVERGAKFSLKGRPLRDPVLNVSSLEKMEIEPPESLYFYTLRGSEKAGSYLSDVFDSPSVQKAQTSIPWES